MRHTNKRERKEARNTKKSKEERELREEEVGGEKEVMPKCSCHTVNQQLKIIGMEKIYCMLKMNHKNLKI